MRCPRCWSVLKVTGQRRLETLIEHVCTPNDEPSLKDAYGCVNPRCSMTGRAVWDDFGDAYQSGGDALFSWSWHYRVWRRHWDRFVRHQLIRLRYRFKVRIRGQRRDW